MVAAGTLGPWVSPWGGKEQQPGGHPSRPGPTRLALSSKLSSWRHDVIKRNTDWFNSTEALVAFNPWESGVQEEWLRCKTEGFGLEFPLTVAKLSTPLFSSVHCSLTCKQARSPFCWAQPSHSKQECDPPTSRDRLEPGVSIYIASGYIQ